MSKNFEFLSIGGEGYAEYKVKGSKFLAFAYEIGSEEEIREYLQQLREKYPDATHHCYAWMLGADQEKFRANDDGEPGNSAGQPILRQIRSLQLSNVLVVVVRYYGGTQLGVSGLIQAYGTAAREALEASPIVVRRLQSIYKMSYPFGEEGQAYRLIQQLGAAIMDQGYEPDPNIRFRIDTEKEELLDMYKETYFNLIIEKE